MRVLFLSLAALIIVSTTSFSAKNSLVVTSTAFTNNGMIPIKYTCMGQGINPPLHISNIPTGTQSLAIILDDPDARQELIKTIKKKTHSKHSTVTTTTADSCYNYWVMWNIDPDDGNIPEDFRSETTGWNTFGVSAYQGICPISGTHHFHFKVYALNTKLNISKTTNKADLLKVMKGHILAQGELIGLFNKQLK